jgi:hypothetical protein
LYKKVFMLYVIARKARCGVVWLSINSMQVTGVAFIILTKLTTEPYDFLDID